MIRQTFIAFTKRSIASALSIALISTSCNLSQAAVVLPDLATIVSLPPQLELIPPPQLGRVSDYFASPTDNKKLVILIQDLHAHYGVQKNIAGLLEFLSQKLGSRPQAAGNPRASSLQPGASVPFALAVEGAEGPVDSSVLALFPDRVVKQAASDYLLREGELTGIEYFSIVRGLPTFPVGVENEQYYMLHRDLFRKTLKDREQLVGVLKALQTQLHSLQKTSYGPGLREFQTVLDKYDNGQLGLSELVRLMINDRTTAQIPWKQKFPDLAHYVSTLGDGALENVPTADQRRGYTSDFLMHAEKYLAPDERRVLATLAKESDNTAYYLYLRDLVEKHQLFLAIPVELARYLEYLHTTQTVGMDRIMRQASDLAFEIKLRKASANSEKDLVQVEHDLALLIMMADLQATEADVKSFGPRLNQFIALCGTLLATSGVQSFDEPRIRTLISSSIDYYAIALMRNKPMVDHTLALMASTPTAVLVAGGFHTESIATLLRQQNVSYVVITPTVDSVTPADGDLYIKRLDGDLLTVSQVLSDARDSSNFALASRSMKSSAAGLHPSYPLALASGAAIGVAALFAMSSDGHALTARAFDIFTQAHLAWSHLPLLAQALVTVKASLPSLAAGIIPRRSTDGLDTLVAKWRSNPPTKKFELRINSAGEVFSKGTLNFENEHIPLFGIQVDVDGFLVLDKTAEGFKGVAPRGLFDAIHEYNDDHARPIHMERMFAENAIAHSMDIGNAVSGLADHLDAFSNSRELVNEWLRNPRGVTPGLRSLLEGWLQRNASLLTSESIETQQWLIRIAAEQSTERTSALGDALHDNTIDDEGPAPKGLRKLFGAVLAALFSTVAVAAWVVHTGHIPDAHVFSAAHALVANSLNHVGNLHTAFSSVGDLVSGGMMAAMIPARPNGREDELQNTLLKKWIKTPPTESFVLRLDRDDRPIPLATVNAGKAGFYRAYGIKVDKDDGRLELNEKFDPHMKASPPLGLAAAINKYNYSVALRLDGERQTALNAIERSDELKAAVDTLAGQFKGHSTDIDIKKWILDTRNNNARNFSEPTEVIIRKWMMSNDRLLTPLKSETLYWLLRLAFQQSREPEFPKTRIVIGRSGPVEGTPLYVDENQLWPSPEGLVLFRLGDHQGPNLIIDVKKRLAYTSVDPSQKIRLDPPRWYVLWSREKVYRVGRGRANDLNVPDPRNVISRDHVSITVTKESFIVKDNSKNGTVSLNPIVQISDQQSGLPGMKGIGIDNGVNVSNAVRSRWLASAEYRPVETKMIAGRLVSAIFVVDSEMTPGFYGSYLRRGSQLIIVTRENVVEGSGSIAEMAAYHEFIEASEEDSLGRLWVYQVLHFIPIVARWQDRERRHNAHILASAQQLLAFGNSWHLGQLETMTSEERRALISENRHQHHRMIRQRFGELEYREIHVMENQIIDRAKGLQAQTDQRVAQRVADLSTFDRLMKNPVDHDFGVFAQSIPLSDAGRHIVSRTMSYSDVNQEHPLVALSTIAMAILENHDTSEPKIIDHLEATIQRYNALFEKSYGAFSIPWLFSFSISGIIDRQYESSMRTDAQQFARVPDPYKGRTIGLHLLQVTLHRPGLGASEVIDSDMAIDLLRAAFQLLREDPSRPDSALLQEAIAITVLHYKTHEVEQLVDGFGRQDVLRWIHSLADQEAAHSFPISSLTVSLGTDWVRLRSPVPIDDYLLSPWQPDAQRFLKSVQGVGVDHFGYQGTARFDPGSKQYGDPTTRRADVLESARWLESSAAALSPIEDFVKSRSVGRGSDNSIQPVFGDESQNKASYWQVIKDRKVRTYETVRVTATSVGKASEFKRLWDQFVKQRHLDANQFPFSLDDRFVTTLLSENENPIGFYQVQVAPETEFEKTPVLKSFFVSPDAQGLGVESALFEDIRVRLLGGDRDAALDSVIDQTQLLDYVFVGPRWINVRGSFFGTNTRVIPLDRPEVKRSLPTRPATSTQKFGLMTEDVSVNDTVFKARLSVVDTLVLAEKIRKASTNRFNPTMMNKTAQDNNGYVLARLTPEQVASIDATPPDATRIDRIRLEAQAAGLQYPIVLGSFSIPHISSMMILPVDGNNRVNVAVERQIPLYAYLPANQAERILGELTHRSDARRPQHAVTLPPSLTGLTEKLTIDVRGRTPGEVLQSAALQLRDSHPTAAASIRAGDITMLMDGRYVLPEADVNHPNRLHMHSTIKDGTFWIGKIAGGSGRENQNTFSTLSLRNELRLWTLIENSVIRNVAPMGNLEQYWRQIFQGAGIRNSFELRYNEQIKRAVTMTEKIPAFAKLSQTEQKRQLVINIQANIKDVNRRRFQQGLKSEGLVIPARGQEAKPAYDPSFPVASHRLILTEATEPLVNDALVNAMHQRIVITDALNAEQLKNAESYVDREFDALLGKPLSRYQQDLFNFYVSGLGRNIPIEFGAERPLKPINVGLGTWSERADIEGRLVVFFTYPYEDQFNADPRTGVELLTHELSHTYDGLREEWGQSPSELRGYTGPWDHNLLFREFRANLWASDGDVDKAYRLTYQLYNVRNTRQTMDLLSESLAREQIYRVLWLSTQQTRGEIIGDNESDNERQKLVALVLGRDQESAALHMNVAGMIVSSLITAFWFGQFGRAWKQLGSALKLSRVESLSISQMINNEAVGRVQLRLSQSFRRVAQGKTLEVYLIGDGGGETHAISNGSGFSVGLNGHITNEDLLVEIADHELAHVMRASDTAKLYSRWQSTVLGKWLGGIVAWGIDEFLTANFVHQLTEERSPIHLSDLAHTNEAIRTATSLRPSDIDAPDPEAAALITASADDHILSELRAKRRAILTGA